VDAADEDCDGKECVVWAKRFGDANDQEVNSIASDSQDNIYVAGRFTGAMDLGDGNHFSAGSYDFFLAKLKPDGTPIWFTQFPGLSAFDMKVDAADNVIVAVSVSADVTVNGTTFTQAGGPLVLKIDSAGTVVWARQLDVIYTIAIAVTPSGDVAATGMIQKATDLGTGPLPFVGAYDGYLVKLASSDGHTLWAKAFGTPGAEEGIGLTSTAAGDIVVAGYYNQSLTFGGASLPAPPPGAFWAFLAKFDVNGNHVFSSSYQFMSSPMYLTATPNGSIYMGIGFGPSAKFEGSTVNSGGVGDGALLKFTSQGQLIKSTIFGGPMLDRVTGVASDASGNVLVGLAFGSDIAVGSETLVLQGTSGRGVIKYNALDELVWTRGWEAGTVGTGYLPVSASKTSLRVLVGGELSVDSTIGGIATTAAGGTDGLIASFLPQ